MILFLLQLACADPATPCYSAATVVNAASGQPVLAPNTFATLYGRGLSFSTKALSGTDVAGGTLPVILPSTGVAVSVGGIGAPIWYASPTQVNFLVPSQLRPNQEVIVQLNRDGHSGPEVKVRLTPESPALFASDPETVVAVTLAGKIVDRSSPARAGDTVILFATGLGPTVPDTPYRQVARTAARLARRSEFGVLFDGLPIEGSLISYVGAAPGFAGLYQINLTIPETAANPEIRIALGESLSQPGLRLAVAK